MCSRQQSETNAIVKALELNPLVVEGGAVDTFLVDSTSNPFQTYTVYCVDSFETAHCECKAGQKGLPCCHVGAVLVYKVCGYSCCPEDREALKRAFAPVAKAA